VQRYERELLEMMQLRHPEVLDEIADKKDLSSDLTQRLTAILKDFTELFKATIRK